MSKVEQQGRVFAGDADIKKSAIAHRMLFDHIAAERPNVLIDKKSGAELTQWSNALRMENHWWDCLVGCFISASEQGCVFDGHKVIGTETTKRKFIPAKVRF